MDFVTWGKIPRFNRDWEITEKIDGTNGVLYWSDKHDGRFDTSSVLAARDDMYLYAGSRNRWLRPESDNFGFARWAQDNADDLYSLGPGRHYGEWYGQGIQRGYGLNEKRFALFDTSKWRNLMDPRIPKGVDVVPVVTLCTGTILQDIIRVVINDLKRDGSLMVPGAKPEGIVIRHLQNGARFKVLCEGDEVSKYEWSQDAQS